MTGPNTSIGVGSQVYFSLKLIDISEIGPDGFVFSKFSLNINNVSDTAYSILLLLFKTYVLIFYSN